MTRSTRRSITVIVCSALALTTLSCDRQDPSLPSPDTVASSDENVDFPVPLPSSLLTSRAVDRDALSVTVIAGRRPVETVRREDGTWTARFRVPPGDIVPVAITWFERFEDAPLPLSTRSLDVGPIDTDRTLEIDPDRYDETLFDRDGDGIPNLDEREADTDPLRAPGREAKPLTAAERVSEEPLPSPPGADSVLDALILPLTSISGRPALDGLFYGEPSWENNVSARNVDGKLLFVNRLIEDRTPSTVDGLQGYQWLAMHDFTYLYLYVVFERGNDRTDEVNPHRDSDDSFHDDDMLNLYFDGDHSRGAELDGVDDRHLVIPLIRPEPQKGQPLAFSPDPPSASLAESLDFHACVCEAEQESAWELRIPIAELGITFDRPFGFEIRIDQDTDGGLGESSWGWATPTPEEREAGFRHGSPAYYGTVMLSSTR